ncbi:MAG TPA: hypothetical protein ENH82_15455 [bacterium]|nr:hypothetical protein [bacterium]
MNKTKLQQALEIVKPGLASKEMIEQSTSFAFIDGRVVTYNDEISLSHPVEGLEIEGAIQAEELYKLLSKIKQEEDEIEISIEKNEVILQVGRMKAGLSLQQEIKLPLEEIGELSRWKTLPEDFIRFVGLAMQVCSRDMSRPVLTCVHVNKNGQIEGSDGFRIIRCELEKEMPVKTFLIPANSAAELVRLQPTKVAEGSGWMHFKTDEETILSCRTFQDDFPDCEPFLKVEGVEIIFPKTIKEIVGRAEVFAKRDHFLDETIEITIGKKRITVKSRSDSGWFEEGANIRYNDEPVSFSITPYLLKDILTETPVCALCEDRLKFEGAGWVSILTLRGK